jgi:hypothetical protein
MSELTARFFQNARQWEEKGSWVFPVELYGQSMAFTVSGFLWPTQLTEFISADELQTIFRIISPHSAQDNVSIFSEQEQLINQLSELYSYRNPIMVKQFLRRNPFLIGLLLKGYAEIQQYFGRDTQVILEVFTDPEAESDQELFALVQTTLSPEEALDNLDNLYQGWWLEALPTAQCKMTIDVE